MTSQTGPREESGPAATLSSIFLVRHGETQWSLAGKHTGRTDIALTANGERQAARLGAYLRQLSFSSATCSPRLRAKRTCELVDLGVPVAIDDDLSEWDYGEYEGLTSSQIESSRPDWNVWSDGCPGGESPDEISARADGVLARLRSMRGNVAVFSHGHFCCALAVRWIEQSIRCGRYFELSPATASILSFAAHHASAPVIRLWNASPS